MLKFKHSKRAIRFAPNLDSTLSSSFLTLFLTVFCLFRARNFLLASFLQSLLSSVFAKICTTWFNEIEASRKKRGKGETYREWQRIVEPNSAERSMISHRYLERNCASRTVSFVKPKTVIKYGIV